MNISRKSVKVLDELIHLVNLISNQTQNSLGGKEMIWIASYENIEDNI